MFAYDIVGITLPGEIMKNLALILPVLATFTIACDATEQPLDITDTTNTSREVDEDAAASAQRTTYVTRSATVINLLSRAARQDVEALETLHAMGCEIEVPESLSATDGSCVDVGDAAFTIDISGCETPSGDTFDGTVSVGGDGIAEAFALASGSGQTAEDFLAMSNEHPLQIEIDTGSDYSIDSCGFIGRNGLKTVSEQEIDIQDPSGGYVNYNMMTNSHGLFNPRAVQRISLELHHASQPENEADRIDLTVRARGETSLTPESGYATVSGADASRIIFRRHLSKENRVLVQSTFSHNGVVEIPML